MKITVEAPDGTEEDYDGRVMIDVSSSLIIVDNDDNVLNSINHDCWYSVTVINE